MAMCGFCKEEIVLKGYEKKNPPPNAVRREHSHKASMFTCPHCGAVLGFYRWG